MRSNVALSLFREYLEQRNYSRSTSSRYYREVRAFLQFCHKQDIRDVTSGDVLNYQSYLHSCNRYVKTTQAGMLNSVSFFFRFLSKHEVIILNPIDCIDISIVKRKVKRDSVSQDVLSAILDSIDGTNYLDVRDRSLFELMYGSGLRVGETTRLKLTDIDYKTGKIFIHQGKGKKDRIVPVGKNVLEYLNSYLEFGRNYLKKIIDRQILFLSYRGRKLTVEAVEYSLRKRTKKLYPDMRIYPHMLRHSFATHMLEAGAEIKQIKDILGHNSIESTVIYTHFNAVSMKKILKMYHPRENELYEDFNENEFSIFQQ